MKIVQAYTPLSTAEEKEIDQFYENIKRALAVSVCSQTFRRLIEDFNAKVSKQLEETVMSTFGIGVRNDISSTLIHLSLTTSTISNE